MKHAYHPLLALLFLAAPAAAQAPAERGPAPRHLHHGNVVTGVVFAPDGKWLASASWDRTIRVWSPDGLELETLAEARREEHSGLAVSADGRYLASGSPRGVTEVWEAATGRRVRAFPAQPGHIYGAALSPDGRLVAACGQTQEVVVWEVESGRERHRLRGHVGRVWAVHFSPDGATLLSCADDGTCRLWDADRGALVRELVPPREYRDARFGVQMYRCAFSPDGRLVAGGTSAGGLLVWESATGGLAAGGWPHGSEAVHALAFSPDGRRVLTGHAGGRVSVTDLPTGRVVGHVQGHSGPVYAVAATPDGRRFASCGQDRRVHLWGADAFAASDPAYAAPPPETARDPERLWAELGDPSAARAYRAVWELGASPRAAVPLLRERLKPYERARGDEVLARVPALVADLDAPRFAAREAAGRQLSEAGPIVLPAVREALAGARSAEVRARLEQVIDRVATRRSGDEWSREDRAVAALEQVRTPEATALLRDCAAGHPRAPLSIAAHRALHLGAR